MIDRLNDRINELSGKEYTEKYYWFPFEWKWARSDKEYNYTSKDIDLCDLVKEVLSINYE